MEFIEALIAWRKLRAGLTGNLKPQVAAKEIAQATLTTVTNQITQIIQASPLDLDDINDGTSYKRVAASELSAGIYKSAALTDEGIIEIATVDETNTGTDATRAVSPDGLAGSIFGEKLVYLKVIAEGTGLTVGDGKMYFAVPDSLNGMNLVDVDAAVYTVSSSGLPTVQIHNLTDVQDMLSTSITIDVSEFSSYTAATPPVINTTYDDVLTGERIRIDVDGAGTSTAGLDVILTFQLP